MKKILNILPAVVLLFLVSCNSKEKGAVSDNAKKNLENFHAVNKMIQTGDFSRIGDYIAADAVDHGSENGPSKGLEAIKADLMKSSSQMSDMKNEVIKEFADDDYVMAWQRYTGTAKTDYMGMKAGQTMNSTAIEVVKFNKDGKATEHWTFVEPAEMMKMMGGQQPPMSDTTKPK
jgi:predicted ester cyclase